MGQLGDKMEGGLKYMWGAQAVQQNFADTLYKMANSLRKGEKTYTENDMKIATAMLMKLMRFDSKVSEILGRGLRLRGVLKDAHMDLSSESILNQVKNFEKWNGNFKEFIEGVPQFVVSIALVEDGEPIVGVLYNPVTTETFTAAKGEGAQLDGEPIRCLTKENVKDMVILNSRSETRRGL